MRQTSCDLAGIISLVSPRRRELSSLFVVFVISEVGVTDYAVFGWRQAEDVAVTEG